MKRIIITTLTVSLLGGGSVAAQSELYPQHFDLENVTLLSSPMKTAMDKNIEQLLAYDADRLMAPFIRQAGLADTPGSKYYGWLKQHPSFTNWGLSDWSLEGHVGGHYLTALSLAYSACHDADTRTQLKERLDYCIGIMQDCQTAYDNNTQGLYGFIGGQPINEVWTGLYANDLDAYKRFGGWVPFYCQHKVLAGLRDAWVYADSKTARDMFRKLADWSVNLVSKLSDADMQTVLGWEHGGMNETLADAYTIFGDEKYLTAAKKYNHKYEVDGMQGTESTYSRTFLNGQHANTQVPKFIGFERIQQEAPSESRLRTAAQNFWSDVATNRTVCIGGNSVSEHFLAADRCSQYMANLDGPESCNSNNMLKLSENLFDDSHDAKYADFYEQTMWNHILSTQDPETGGYVYFTSLRPQSYRIYSKVNQAMWCCVGTGMENHSKYGHFIYTHDGNKTLYVNLFTASELNDETFGIRQETEFPYEQSTKLTITKSGTYSLAVRHPAWTTKDFSITVNGVKETTDASEGKASYCVISERKWKKGDVITVSLPMELRYEECPNYGDYIAFKYGPILLAAKTTAASQEEAQATGLEFESLQNEYAGEGRMDHAPGCMATIRSLSSAPMLIGDRKDVLNRIQAIDLKQLKFNIDASREGNVSQWNTLCLEPFYNIHHARYSCYWYQQTPEGYAESDMGKKDAEVQALLDRTLDFVAPGEQQSEAGHYAKYSLGSTSGTYSGETYRDAKNGEYIQYTLSNEKGETERLSIFCRFTTADKNRAASISVDGVKIADITIPATHADADDMGFYNIEFPLTEELMKDDKGNAKKSITFRITAFSSTLCPGLYGLRLLRNYNDHAYVFKASDWITGDANRIPQDKISYDEQNNVITLNAGTGINNVCLRLNNEECKYTASATQKYLVVKGTNLKIGSGASYLWWLNGVNRGSSVAPTVAKTLTVKANDTDASGSASSQRYTVVAWDMTNSGLDANNTGDRFSVCQGWTIFGLTSTTGISTINYIGFEPSIDDYIAAVGIDEVGAERGVSGIYNLQGMKVNPSAPLTEGIYIINRKKTFVKKQ